jgi:hypothetical protein
MPCKKLGNFPELLSEWFAYQKYFLSETQGEKLSFTSALRIAASLGLTFSVAMGASPRDSIIAK